MSQINLLPYYKDVLSAFAPLVKAKIEPADDGNTITLYFGSKYVGIFLAEDAWLEVCFYDLNITGSDPDGEWDKVLLSFYLGADATDLEANIFVTSVVAAIKDVYYGWVDGSKPLPQFLKESWNPKDGMPTRKESNG